MMFTLRKALTGPGLLTLAILLLFGFTTGPAHKADTPAASPNNEGLGSPSIAIATGTGVAAGGVGLQDAQPGVINVNVPAGATVKQVLLYWTGATRTTNPGVPVPGDDDLVADGNDVTGTLIGGPSFFFNFQGEYYYSSYRADITGLGLISPGANAVTVSGLDNVSAGFGEDSGAGILVIYDDGTTAASIGLKDGLDLAFDGFPEPRKSTIAQSFGFLASASDRTADLVIFAGSVGEDRTSIIRVTPNVGPVQDFTNLLGSNDGSLWDTHTLAVNIPAGASQVTVEIISGDGTAVGEPASLNWIGAGLSVPGEEMGGGCSYTMGYWKTHNASFWGGPEPDPTWHLLGDWDGDGTSEAEQEDFFKSGQTWFEVFWTPVGGNAYYNLAHQWMAAYLNKLNDADVTSISSELTEGQTLFETYAPSEVGKKQKKYFNPLAETLDDYNNGIIGPGHCDDEELKTGKTSPRQISGIASDLPEAVAAHDAYPNPFVGSTNIRFTLAQDTRVRLVVYDVLGRQVQSIADGAYAAGTYDMTFEAGSLPSGTYFYRIDTDFGSTTSNMVLAR